MTSLGWVNGDSVTHLTEFELSFLGKSIVFFSRTY
jgi:hypothetical protein